MENVYYIYAWYYKSSGEIFYIGKGKNLRYCDTTHSRNAYFKNILNAHKEDVDVKFLHEGLSGDEAADLERKLIHEYWDKGQCKANFHEGGYGGNTGNYNNPERSRKLSESAKKRTGEKNPMFGRTHTKEVREFLSLINKGKKLTPEHIEKLKASNRGRKKSQEERDAISRRFKGTKMSPEQYKKMMERECRYLYIVTDNGVEIKVCHSLKDLEKYCDGLGMSRSITSRLIKGKWEPKFKKHMHLSGIKITRIEKGVSTMGDECNPVE